MAVVSNFLENAAKLFPGLADGYGASEGFPETFLQSITDLHRSLTYGNEILCPVVGDGSSHSEQDFVTKDVPFYGASHSCGARLVAGQGGVVTFLPGSPMAPSSPRSSPSSPETAEVITPSSSSDAALCPSYAEGGQSWATPDFAITVTSSSPSSLASSSSSSASPSSSGVCKPLEIILDFEHIKEEMASGWGEGSPLYPTGAPSVYQSTRSHVETLLKETRQPDPVELSHRRLGLLQEWGAALDSLSPQNKAAIWATCELSPLFGFHLKTSFRRTIKIWSQDPELHATSIRVLFGAIGYLKYHDVLKNQFLCLRTGEHIFRTFIFEEPEEIKPCREEPRPKRTPATRSQNPPSVKKPSPKRGRCSSVDVLVDAAISALLEDGSPKNPARTIQRKHPLSSSSSPSPSPSSSSSSFSSPSSPTKKARDMAFEKNTPCQAAYPAMLDEAV